MRSVMVLLACLISVSAHAEYNRVSTKQAIKALRQNRSAVVYKCIPVELTHERRTIETTITVYGLAPKQPNQTRVSVTRN